MSEQMLVLKAAGEVRLYKVTERGHIASACTFDWCGQPGKGTCDRHSLQVGRCPDCGVDLAATGEGCRNPGHRA